MSSAPHALDDLLEFLHRTRGVDFSGYKPASLGRRIQKRMTAVGTSDHTAYLDYLQVHPEEFQRLFDTLLINVTAFFRDIDTWDLLLKEAIPSMLARQTDGQIRAWSAGCASGQEAFTIAIVLAEILGEDEAIRRMKIYATDIDEDALRYARQGIYTAKEAESLPEGLLEKYFVPAGESFELRRELRRCVIFGRHDLVRDAPISRVDLLSCRNALMYLNAETQGKILARLRFALKDGGLLVLGKAEMLLTHASLFTPVDLKRHIFAPVPRTDLPPPAPRGRANPDPGAGQLAVVSAAYDAAPSAQIAIDATGALILANRRARELFSLGGRDIGRPIQDLEISYRPANLRTMIDQVYADGRPVTLRDVERVGIGTDSTFFDVHIIPLRDRKGVLGAEITFTEVTEASQLRRELRHANQEVETAYAELQSAGEELETTNEELQSTIEELETTNEELHSTNEELETTNEELQSANEELRTLNDALRERSGDLGEANVFLESILSTLGSAVIVIDEDMRVQIWNGRAQELWGLRGDEVRGRNLMALDVGLPTEELTSTIRACFAGEERKELFVDAMNRRGKAIRCSVTCTRLTGDAVTRGSVLVINELDRATN